MNKGRQPLTPSSGLLAYICKKCTVYYTFPGEELLELHQKKPRWSHVLGDNKNGINYSN